MKKFRIRQPLREILFMQGFGDNPWAYSSFAPKVTGGHIGVDIAFGDGDPVCALYTGEVVFKQEDSIVVLSLVNTDCDIEFGYYEIVYSHCRDWKVNVGDLIQEGDVIGYQSSVGPSVMWKEDSKINERIAWSHLHISMRPVKMLRPGEEYHHVDTYWDFAGALSPKKYEYIPTASDTHNNFIDPMPFSERVIERIADAIEAFENNAKWMNNPGALRFSPREDGFVITTKGRFSTFTSYARGRAALIHQIEIAADSDPNNSIYPVGLSLFQFLSKYAPPKDYNDPERYSRFVVDHAGIISIHDPISDFLLTELEWAKKYTANPWYPYPEVNVLQDAEPTEEGVKRAGIISDIVKKFKELWNVINRDGFKGLARAFKKDNMV